MMKPKQLNPQAVAAAQLQRMQKFANDQPFQKCARCGSEAFIGASMIKHLSRILTGEAQDTTIRFDVSICAECHRPWKPNDKLEEGEETQ